MPRKNDPLGVSDNPVCVTDPLLQAKIVKGLDAKLEYLEQHYHIGRSLYGAPNSWNEGLRHLREVSNGKIPDKLCGTRVPPLLEMCLSMKARKIAEERLGKETNDIDVTSEDKTSALAMVLESVSPASHRPKNEFLEHFVEGLVALIQETSGKPVMASRHRNSVYEPHFAEGVSQMIPAFFETVDPSVTVTQLVVIVERLRKKNRGERLRFIDYFPTYGAQLGHDGSILSPNGQPDIVFKPNFPTYFR